MAGVDDLFKGNLVTGLAVGVGVAVLAPLLLPVVVAVARPLAKSAIKAGIILYEQGIETVAEVGEVVEDLVAEAKAEIGAAAVAGEAVSAEEGPKKATRRRTSTKRPAAPGSEAPESG